MSAQGGLYNSSGESIDCDQLSEIARTLTRWGPDGGGIYIMGPMGLAYCAFHTTKHSWSEKQPLIRNGKLALTWDGRLDNREDLIPQLRQLLEDDESDASIVLAGFQQWGVEFLERIVGDWALALCDFVTRNVVLARDFAGNRPLYYAVAKNLVIWSSQLETFLELTDAQCHLSDEYILEFLAAYPRADRTPYDRVYAVPPGGAVVFKSGGMIKKRAAWRPDLMEKIVYPRDEDYQDHFRLLFRNAVRCRLRAEGEVWSELSGGLDSSSIVCMADEILRENSAQADSLVTVSYLLSQDLDEDRNYIRQVELKRGRIGHHLLDESHGAFFPEPSAPILTRPLGVPGRLTALAHDMESRAARVLLSGVGGDNVMWSSLRRIPYLADLLSCRRIGELHRQLEKFSLATGRTYWDLLWNEGLRPALSKEPISVNRSRPEWLLNGRTPDGSMGEISISENLANSILPSRRLSLLLILDSIRFCALHHFRTCGLIEVSYPYLDSRLVQFMLSVPFDQKLRPTGTRWLHRGAMRGILPENIVNRTTKVGAAPYICRALRREWDRIRELFEGPLRLKDRGYVNQQSLFEAIARARDGREADLFYITRALGAEVWLREIATIRQSVTSAFLSQVAIPS